MIQSSITQQEVATLSVSIQESLQKMHGEFMARINYPIIIGKGKDPIPTMLHLMASSLNLALIHLRGGSPQAAVEDIKEAAHNGCWALEQDFSKAEELHFILQQLSRIYNLWSQCQRLQDEKAPIP